MGSKRPARREFLRGGAALAGGLTVGAVEPALAQTPGPARFIRGDEDMIAYGERSRFVTSVRIPHPPGGRESPDAFGLVFHVAAPLQDSVGMITPSSLHFVGTTRGSFIPEIDPREHRFLLHGMVDRPLTFTMEDLKRLPSVTRPHFIECAGNRARGSHKTVQETHGMTSCAEWTGVLLSVLLEEAGVKEGASWVVAEGSEEVKGASSFPLAKAMDDCVVAYGMNGEALRPQNGFPLRLVIPGFEGIFNTKYLRRMKVVDRYYMNYNDFGHLRPDPVSAALGYQIGPKSVITFPSAGQQLPGRGFYEISGLAWSGGGAVRRVEVSTDGGGSWMDAELKGTVYRMAHTRFGLRWNWDGQETELLSRCTDEIGQVQPLVAQVAEHFDASDDPSFRVPGLDNTIQPWRVASDGSVHNGRA
jgi:sulfane dehydrogenase subunit SoxC